MAENKKSVILYTDLIHTFEQLTDAQAGRLIKHLFRYVNDKNPQPPDKITTIAFEPIKQQLKRDLKKWEKYIEKQRDNGKKGGRPKEPTETQKTQAFSEEPKKADSVNVNANVTVTEEGGVDEATEKKIKDFTTNQKWKEEFCIAKNISPGALEKYQQEFLTEKSLTGESVYSYKRYFLFWYNKKMENGTHKQPVRKSGKPGKSDGANILLDSLRQEHDERPG